MINESDLRAALSQHEDIGILHERIIEGAVCASIGLDGWEAAVDEDEAHKICAHCPVKKLCLQYALITEGARSIQYRWGCWGGTYPAQRRALYEHYARAHRQKREAV
ncbi:hypothetical protein HHJ78_10965 [Mobiluncus mulieris]|uniref:4Fe-4S Wbl-type domain-containing protein n=2 Tax=Mobiluncus mulieris TaxID=2052 RepID=A0A7Y0Y543_9ACTO|nr:hypothetical protein [Mobiluncus mulieris]